ncbi:two pore domain potassium channel family protein [Nocardioides sp. GY 10113]|uniref:potassium channel family protein n=1 Tax=Nocardioides sp. GY 10113 TaxID=2569761 RepID=UPI0010A7E538|nr:potassium channel family protein [Nocardioides sp. GY 10113]TIC87741.1 two pore domain potassium channel family protein [Nocardioides sp. GY 10113]
MARRLAELEASRRWREVATTTLTLLVTWSALLGVYFLIGPAGHAAWTAVGVLVVGAVIFAMSVTRQLRRVVAADLPELRAIQALGTIVILFLVLFASAYLTLSDGSFSRPLDHVGALYFAVTVFSTVGFGDITPETDLARIVVAVQMLLDLVLIGVIVRTFVSAAKRGLDPGAVAEEDRAP